ncbi:MAG: DUF1579 family protein [Planctomycetota bacterium]
MTTTRTAYATILTLLTLPLAPAALAQEGMDMGPPKPGAEHKQLARFVGTWDIEVKNHDVPGGEPMTMKGVDESKLCCNGLWLVSKVTGVGMPFSGMAFTGYDTASEQYVGIWVDSMTSAPARSKGTFDAKTSSFHLTGEMSTPEGLAATRSECTFPDADTRKETVWTIGDDGKEKLSMELTYKRQKAGGRAAPAAAPKIEPAIAGSQSPTHSMHKHLAAYAGTWDATMKMTMPGMPPFDSKMKQVDTLVCGDLWVHTVVNSGDFMGAPFEGQGLMGYDVDSGEYVNFWFDTMTTTYTETRGEASEDGSEFTLKGTNVTPAGPTRSTDVTRFHGKDKRTMTMSWTMEDGTDAGSMTIEYTRSK